MQQNFDQAGSRLDRPRIDNTGLFGRKFMYTPYHNAPLDLTQFTPRTISAKNQQIVVPSGDFEMIIPPDMDKHPSSAFHVSLGYDGSLMLTHESDRKVNLKGRRFLVVREDRRGHVDKGKLERALKANNCDAAVVVALNTGLSVAKEPVAYNIVLEASPDLSGVRVSLSQGVTPDSNKALVFYTSPTGIARSAASVTITQPIRKDATAPANLETTQQLGPDRIDAPPTFQHEKVLHQLGGKYVTVETASGTVESTMGPTNTIFSVGICTTEGSCDINEDHAKVAVYILPNGMQVADMTVKDGLGGHDAGDVAAVEANDGGSRYLEALANENGRDQKPNWEQLQEEAQQLQSTNRKLNFEAALGLILASKVLQAENSAVYKWKQATRSNGGSTRSGALLIGSMAFIANCGDSRTEVFDASGYVIKATKDHSLVQGLVDTGQITPQEALTHPNRNTIYKALGIKVTAQAEMYEDILMCHIPIGGTFAVHCDGINGGLSEVLPGEKIGPLVADKNVEVGKIARNIVLQAAPNSADNDTIIVARRIK